MTTWGDLFESAAAYDVTEASVRETLAERRARRAGERDDVDPRDDDPGNGGEDDD